ncbi:MAG: hypothetical protein AAB551_02460 [Patescibacteria group bacterium]
MDKYLRIALVSGILIASTSSAYYYSIFLPKNEQAKIEIQKSAPAVIEKKKTETPLPKPTKKNSQPYIAPKIFKDTNLEIEKCKIKLIEGLPDIETTLTSIEEGFHFQAQINKLKNDLKDALNMTFECIKLQTDDQGRELCQIPINSIKQNIDAYEKQRTNMLEEITKRSQQYSYQQCLESI